MRLDLSHFSAAEGFASYARAEAPACVEVPLRRLDSQMLFHRKSRVL